MVCFRLRSWKCPPPPTKTLPSFTLFQPTGPNCASLPFRRMAASALISLHTEHHCTIPPVREVSLACDPARASAGEHVHGDGADLRQHACYPCGEPSCQSSAREAFCLMIKIPPAALQRVEYMKVEMSSFCFGSCGVSAEIDTGVAAALNRVIDHTVAEMSKKRCCGETAARA